MYIKQIKNSLQIKKNGLPVSLDPFQGQKNRTVVIAVVEIGRWLGGLGTRRDIA